MIGQRLPNSRRSGGLIRNTECPDQTGTNDKLRLNRIKHCGLTVAPRAFSYPIFHAVDLHGPRDLLRCILPKLS